MLGRIMKTFHRLALAAFLLPLSLTAADWPFYAFDNGVGRGQWTPDQQATTLKELGFDGISYNYTSLKDLAAWQKAHAAAGTKIFGLYVHTFPDKAEPYPTALREAAAMLKGSETVLWITFREAKEKKDWDEACVKIAREIGDFAASNGLRVAIYHHAGFYVATAADSARIAAKAAHPAVGPSINLCHEFITGHGAQVFETIKSLGGKCTRVSINGVNVAKKEYVATLDSSDFDLKAYLAALRESGYKGPVGLQCYNVKGDIRENLRKSIEAWRKIQP